MKKHFNDKRVFFKTKQRISLFVTATGLLFTSSAAIAGDEISYSFVEAGYFDIDDSGIEPTGYYLKGSFEISDSFYFFAETKQGEGDVLDFNNNEVEFDFDRNGYGFGYQSNINKNLSWFANYSVNEWEIATDDWDVDIIRLGLRGKLTDNLEINGSLTRNSIDYGSSSEDESGYQLGLSYDLSNSVSLTVNYESIDEVDEKSIGMKYSF